MQIDSVNGTHLMSETKSVPNQPTSADSVQKIVLPAESHLSQSPPQPSQREVTVAVEGNQIVYRFVDKRSGELVEQVPPEALLRVMRNIAEILKNMAQKVDQKI